MFQMSFWYDKKPDDQNNVETIDIGCINCGKETGLYMDNMNTKSKYIVTVFLLNTLLHHVGMSWIIETHEQLKYDTDKNNSNWMTGGTWYSTSIYKKLHGIVFEEFIRNAKTDIYNLMCSIDAYDREHLSYFDDVSSGVGYALP